MPPAEFRRLLGVMWAPLEARLTLRPGAVILLSACIARCLPLPLPDLSYVLLAIAAVRNTGDALRSTCLLWLFVSFNTGLAAQSDRIGALRYVVIFAAAVGVWLGVPTAVGARALLRTGILYLVPAVAFHSVWCSQVPDVSFLKCVSWGVATSTSFVGWAGLSPQDRVRLGRWFLLTLSLVVVASVPLVALEVGYLRNGWGFQGALCHPQWFGVTAGLSVVVALRALQDAPQRRWGLVIVCVLGLGGVYLSAARTAGFALFIALIAMAVSRRLMRRGEYKIGTKLASVCVTLLVVLAATATIAPQRLADTLGGYVSKHAKATTAAGIYEESRGGLMSSMLGNIERSPLLGIGFGVASDSENMQVERDELFGLPVGATIEKGVLPLALIEELGVPLGVLAIAWWVLVLRRAAAASGAVIALYVSLVNFAEASLVSAGGMGLLHQLALGYALALVPRPLTAKGV